jgi:hypothetical protein
MTTDWVAIGRQYARDVITGKIPANRWVKLACERSERDFDRFYGTCLSRSLGRCGS